MRGGAGGGRSGGARSRQAKEGKQMSRKAKVLLEVASGTASPASSLGGSRSRNDSRHGSDNESRTFDESDAKALARLLRFNRNDLQQDLPEDKLETCISNLHEAMTGPDWVKMPSGERAALIQTYHEALSMHYLDEDYSQPLEDIRGVLLRCVLQSSNSVEKTLALRALSITAITCAGHHEPGEFFHRTNQAIKASAMDSGSHVAQEAAIHALGTAAFFGRADRSEVEAVMAFLFKIIQTHGESISATAHPSMVAAAVQEWALLATLLGDKNPNVYEALETFKLQLETGMSADVLVAVADSIALLYEQSYTINPDVRLAKLTAPHDDSDLYEGAHSDDEDDEDEYPEAEEDPDDDRLAQPYRASTWIRKFHISFDDRELKAKALEISKATFRSLSRDEKKELHLVFRDLVHALDYPWRGPRFSTAMDHDGDFYAHRVKVKDFDLELVIDRWWKFHRYNAVRRIVQGGFLEHLGRNPVVRRDVVPVVLEPASRFIAEA